MSSNRMVSEYGSNFTRKPPSSAGYLPQWYAHRGPQSQPWANWKSSDNSKSGAMSRWENRTNAQEYGAHASKSYLHSPFSIDDSLKLPKIQSEEEMYRERYNDLLHQLGKKRRLIKDLPGGGKGRWRYIRESYGAGPSLISWVDGPGARTICTTTQPASFRIKERSGKGPFKHIIDSYGAGSSVISWVNGEPPLQKQDKSARFSTCIPLPSLYQEDFGPYTLIGGRRIRADVKALQD